MLPEKNLNNQERIAGACGYIFFIIPVLMGVRTEFTVFHMKQSFILFLLSVASSFIPFFGSIIHIAIVCTVFWCIFQAYTGNKFALPYISEYMDTFIEKIGLLGFFSQK